MENLKKLGVIMTGVYLAIMLTLITVDVYNDYIRRLRLTDPVFVLKPIGDVKLKETWFTNYVTITNYIGESSYITNSIFPPIEPGLTITEQSKVTVIDLLQTNRLDRLDVIANDLKSLMEEIQNRKK